LGNGKVTGVRVRNVKTEEQSVIETSGVFVYVGLIPATKVFADQIALDEAGYVITDENKRTSIPGVFAAGDVENPEFRQCVVAAGSGATAAIQAERYLSSLAAG
jgi:thioredoxin reductase (NADPH)